MYKQFFTLNNLSLKLRPNDLGIPLNRRSSSTNTKQSPTISTTNTKQNQTKVFTFYSTKSTSNMLHNYCYLYNTAIKSAIKDKNLNTTGLTNQYFNPKTNLTGQVLLTNILDSMTQTQNGNTVYSVAK